MENTPQEQVIEIEGLYATLHEIAKRMGITWKEGKGEDPSYYVNMYDEPIGTTNIATAILRELNKRNRYVYLHQRIFNSGYDPKRIELLLLLANRFSLMMNHIITNVYYDDIEREGATVCSLVTQITQDYKEKQREYTGYTRPIKSDDS